MKTYNEFINEAVKIKTGVQFGAWTVTRFTPIKFNDDGSMVGGEVKLVNQNSMDVINIINDHALRKPKWYTQSFKGVRIEDGNLNKIINKSLTAYNKHGLKTS